MNKKETPTRQFSDDEYSIIVLQSLKRLVRRSSWMTEMITPRLVAESENADARDIADALNNAIDAVRAQKDGRE